MSVFAKSIRRVIELDSSFPPASTTKTLPTSYEVFDFKFGKHFENLYEIGARGLVLDYIGQQLFHCDYLEKY